MQFQNWGALGEKVIALDNSRLVVSRLLLCSQEAAWQVITDTEQWPYWGPSVSRVRCAQRYIQLGSTGSVRTVFGFWVPFSINRYQHLHFWSWRIGRFEATGHRLAITKDGFCRISFDMPWWAFPYVLICAIALRRISRLLEAGQA